MDRGVAVSSWRRGGDPPGPIKPAWGGRPAAWGDVSFAIGTVLLAAIGPERPHGGIGEAAHVEWYYLLGGIRRA